MPYDGLAMHVAALELNGLLAGGRIDKVNQPEKDEIHLIIRSGGESRRLVMSSSARYARVHLTGGSKMSPLTAPMFCMVLRKRLVGGRVLSVGQYGMDRVLEMNLEIRDELGVPSAAVLRAEIMGRHSNIILTGADGRIIDSIKHITEEKSRVREVLPGLVYQYPPAQDRLNPLALPAQELESLLDEGGGKPLAGHLGARLGGLAAATLRALLAGVADPDGSVEAMSGDDRRRTALHLQEVFSAMAAGDTRPVLIRDPDTGEAVDFFGFDSDAYPREWRQPRASLQQAMDDYYLLRDRDDRIRERTCGMTESVRRHLDRCLRKLDKQQQTLEDAQKMEQYRLYGELLNGNLHALSRGMTQATVLNWYDPEGGTVDIPLDPLRDGARNAQQYFKKYCKAKVALDLTRDQMEENRREIDYLEGQLHNLAGCRTEAEAEEIRQELMDQGYVKAGSRRDRKALPRSTPLHYRSSDGYDIYVGRNNQQNDALTLRFARADDIWMHTKQIPGSHVIIRAREGRVSDAALAEGAMLAAWHSKAKSSSSVPVDYTQRRYVKKPGGARPGFVIYTTNRTATVTPEAAMIGRLERVEE